MRPVHTRYLIFGALLSIVAASPAPAQPYSVDSTGLPILNSLPSARGVAYIDFNGGTVFGQARGAYDLDGNPATFNAAEQDDIYKAWLDVSAHFAMFDINVTTVAPNKAITPTAHQLVTPDYSGGAANVGFFGDQSSVARGVVNSGNARNRTTAITHEFGHIIGMFHQSAYDSQGNRTAEYRGADPVTNIAPIMGVDFAGKFSSWQDGFTGSNMNPQDDIAIMTNTLITTYNNFPGGAYTGDGFRPDEHGNTMGTATALALNVNGDNVTASAEGIIERYTDTDMFSFDWSGGDLTMTAEAVRNVAASPQYASSLGMNLTLYNSGGQQVAQDLSGAAADVDATVSVAGLTAGTYYFAVESAGAYDDLGAYTLDFDGITIGGELDDGVPNLYYDPGNGMVTLDADGANMISFVLGDGPFQTANTDFGELPAGLADNIASQVGWTSFNLIDGLTGQADIGTILPAGFDLTALRAALTRADFGLSLTGGGGGGRFDIFDIYSVCTPGDTDCDGDIDTLDLTTAIQNFTGAGGSGKGLTLGDTDGDGDVDTVDLTNSIGSFTGALAANPNVPDLIYDPATGNVVIDADGADVISFSLQGGPFASADFSELPAGLTDNIATQIGWTSFNLFSGLTGTADLGAILPAGLDLASLEAALTTASYGLALSGGGGGGRLDIIIPEPATMVLIALGSIVLARRR